MWDADPPEYYDPPGGLLAFRMDYGGLVNGSAPPRDDMELASFMGHFRLVNHQLVQVRLCTHKRLCPSQVVCLVCSPAACISDWCHHVEENVLGEEDSGASIMRLTSTSTT